MIWLVKIDIYRPGFFLMVYDTEELEIYLGFFSLSFFLLLLQCMSFLFVKILVVCSKWQLMLLCHL